MVIQLWTKSEEFAFKKNLAEDTKLRDKLNILSMDNLIKREEIDDDIRSLKHTMKEIKSCTGHSLEELPPLPARTTSRVTDVTSVLYDIPEIIRNKSTCSSKSGLARNNSLFQELDEMLKRKAAYVQLPQIPRAMSTNGNIEAGNREKLDPRKVKSETFGLGSPLSRRTLTRDNTFFNTDDELLSSVFIEEDEESEDEDDEESKQRKLLQQKYNPWKIQHGSGTDYDALELPNIKDCYTPLCRPNCSTCLLRKKKGPCFLVPGLVSVHKCHSHSHARSGSKSVYKNKSRKQKGGKSTRGSGRKLRQTNNQTDTDSDIEKCTFGNEIHRNQQRKPMTERGMTQARLKVLATPRGGFNKAMRFSKAFLKKKVNELKDENSNQQLSDIERENRRRIESKISNFLAHLNKHHIPDKMVDIPLRDDIMKCDSTLLNPVLSHSNNTLTLPLAKKRMKNVNFR